MGVRFLYNSYCWFFRQERWRDRRLTRPGGTAVAGICVFGLLGINVFQSAIYQIFILILAYVLIASVFRFFFRADVAVVRRLPDFGMNGREFTYTLELVNQGRKTARGLLLFEEIADPRPSMDDLMNRREPKEDQRNAWDRRTLWYRWRWLVRQNEIVKLKPVTLPDLPPDTRVAVRVSAVPHARGYLNFTGVSLARPDPLGLFHALDRIGLKGRLLVLPGTYDILPPRVDARRKYHPGGEKLASSVGNTDEFMAIRDYRPGDSLRHLHWKTFARTQTLAVREFEDEFFVRHALLLDTRLPSGREDIFEEAVSIAASLLLEMGSAESLVDLMFVGDRVYTLSAGRGLALSETLLEVLACARPAPARTVAYLMPHLREHLEKLSGGICVFLGWDDDRRELTEMFRRAGVSVHTLVVCEDGQAMAETIRRSAADPATVTVVPAGQVEKVMNPS